MKRALLAKIEELRGKTSKPKAVAALDEAEKRIAAVDLEAAGAMNELLEIRDDLIEPVEWSIENDMPDISDGGSPVEPGQDGLKP
jgi:hypothetical protein